MAWVCRECGSERQPPVAARQPSDAADSESSCQCGGQIQGKHLSNSLSPLRAAYGTQSNHWNNCPQTLSLGLEDIAPRNPVRGTWPRGQQSVQAKAHPKNDPSTPQAWLPNRTDPFAINHPSMTAICDLVRFSTLRLSALEPQMRKRELRNYYGA